MTHGTGATRRSVWVSVSVSVAVSLLASLSSCDRSKPSATQVAVVRKEADPKATIAARQHFFGVENVDPVTGAVPRGKVILSWFGVSSLAAAMHGHVLLLDAYITKRDDGSNYVGTTVDELADLKPEAIFIGHAHSDHGELASYIVGMTGAVLVGTPEHCQQVTDGMTVVFGDNAPEVRCIPTVSEGSAPGAEVVELPLIPDICITVFKHLHSATEPPDTSRPPATTVLVPDVGSYLLHPPGPGAAQSNADGKAYGSNEGFSLFYQFRINDFSLTWHDTSGPLKENNPEVFDIMKRLPPTDVETGAIWGLNFFTNGMRDAEMYLEAVEPKIWYPLHHDYVGPVASADDYRVQFLKDISTMLPKVPDIRWLYDPYDYIRPGLMTFDIDAPQWKDPAGPRPAGTCYR